LRHDDFYAYFSLLSNVIIFDIVLYVV